LVQGWYSSKMPFLISVSIILVGFIGEAKSFSSSQEWCSRKWPKSNNVKRHSHEKCVNFWLQVGYGYNGHGKLLDPKALKDELSFDPSPGNRLALIYNSEELSKIAGKIRTFCKKKCSPFENRAIEYFERESAARIKIHDFYDPVGFLNGVGFESQLKKIVRGETLTKKELTPEPLFSGLTLWILRNGIFARHGMIFRHPDLKHFFYGSRSKLGLKESKNYSDSLLSKADNSNIRLIRDQEKKQFRQNN
jgi:hypothetical protein